MKIGVAQHRQKRQLLFLRSHKAGKERGHQWIFRQTKRPFPAAFPYLVNRRHQLRVGIHRRHPRLARRHLMHRIEVLQEIRIVQPVRHSRIHPHLHHVDPAVGFIHFLNHHARGAGAVQELHCSHIRPHLTQSRHQQHRAQHQQHRHRLAHRLHPIRPSPPTGVIRIRFAVRHWFSLRGRSVCKQQRQPCQARPESQPEQHRNPARAQHTEFAQLLHITGQQSQQSRDSRQCRKPTGAQHFPAH